jgi:hypothetical protein
VKVAVSDDAADTVMEPVSLGVDVVVAPDDPDELLQAEDTRATVAIAESANR